MTDWITGSPKELRAALRPGGNLWGKSGLLPRPLSLSKTDLLADLMKYPPGHKVTWMVIGDPAATGQYASNRRAVVIWLGK